MSIFGNTQGGLGFTCERCRRRIAWPADLAGPLLGGASGWSPTRCPACAPAPRPGRTAALPKPWSPAALPPPGA